MLSTLRDIGDHPHARVLIAEATARGEADGRQSQADSSGANSRPFPTRRTKACSYRSSSPVSFALSAVLWGAFAVGIWYTSVQSLARCRISSSGLRSKAGGRLRILVASISVVLPVFCNSVALFASAWMILSPHPWSLWSILGSALILFTSYFQVQVSVAINSWYGHLRSEFRQRSRNRHRSRFLNSTSNCYLRRIRSLL